MHFLNPSNRNKKKSLTISSIHQSLSQSSYQKQDLFSQNSKSRFDFISSFEKYAMVRSLVHDVVTNTLAIINKKGEAANMKNSEAWVISSLMSLIGTFTLMIQKDSFARVQVRKLDMTVFYNQRTRDSVVRCKDEFQRQLQLQREHESRMHRIYRKSNVSDASYENLMSDITQSAVPTHHPHPQNNQNPLFSKLMFRNTLKSKVSRKRISTCVPKTRGRSGSVLKDEILSAKLSTVLTNQPSLPNEAGRDSPQLFFKDKSRITDRKLLIQKLTKNKRQQRMSSTNTDEKESLKNRNSRFLLSFVKQDVQESKVQRRVKTAYAYPDNSNQNGDPDPLKKTIRLESDNLVYCFDVIDDTRNEKVGSLQEFIDKEFDLRFSGCGWTSRRTSRTAADQITSSASRCRSSH